MNEKLILTNLTEESIRLMIQESVTQALLNFSIPETSKDEELIKVEQVAKILNVSTITVHTWKNSGKIPFHRISNKIYFKKSEVLDAVKKSELGRQHGLLPK